MGTVVVRFADADAAAAGYYIATAGFIGVSRRTRRQTQLPTSTKRTRVDAAAAADTCGNQTNSPNYHVTIS
ncbi:hypothetical protein F2Q69_00000544 [Brassica cretica]|uniref:Uncharacterized protein n=1 Tax=Brassica cretica TaxID=69181 RepID=A0A8S9P934_BRACR|nr:hypothetical protein F2Q69_00000544 [Brassica cretica]